MRISKSTHFGIWCVPVCRKVLWSACLSAKAKRVKVLYTLCLWACMHWCLFLALPILLWLIFRSIPFHSDLYLSACVPMHKMCMRKIYQHRADNMADSWNHIFNLKLRIHSSKHRHRHTHADTLHIAKYSCAAFLLSFVALSLIEFENYFI